MLLVPRKTDIFMFIFCKMLNFFDQHEGCINNFNMINKIFV